MAPESESNCLNSGGSFQKKKRRRKVTYVTLHIKQNEETRLEKRNGYGLSGRSSILIGILRRLKKENNLLSSVNQTI